LTVQQSSNIWNDDNKIILNRLVFHLCTATCSSGQTEHSYHVPTHPWCFKFFSHYVEMKFFTLFGQNSSRGF
jgi:hypothetical protein